MASDLNDAINDIPADCSAISLDNAESLLGRLDLWVSGIFTAPAITTWSDLESRSNRLIMDWHGPTIVARQGIPAGNTDTNVIHESRVTDVVNRTLWAFRKAIEDGALPNPAGATETAIVAAYNAAWT